MSARTSSRVIRSLAVVVAMVALLAGCLSPEQDTALGSLNRDRSRNRVAALQTHGALQAKAQAWAEQIARDGYLHHSVLTQGAPSCWRGLGENVGYGGSIQQIQNAYMQSPPHRANITNSTFTWVGVGVAHSGSRTYTVQVFMRGC